MISDPFQESMADFLEEKSLKKKKKEWSPKHQWIPRDVPH
jgi:hypothetical protein